MSKPSRFTVVLNRYSKAAAGHTPERSGRAMLYRQDNEIERLKKLVWKYSAELRKADKRIRELEGGILRVVNNASRKAKQ